MGGEAGRMRTALGAGRDRGARGVEGVTMVVAQLRKEVKVAEIIVFDFEERAWVGEGRSGDADDSRRDGGILASCRLLCTPEVRRLTERPSSLTRSRIVVLEHIQVP